MPVRQFNSAARNLLRSYEWPGNVRELINLVQRLLILGSGPTIELQEVETSLGIRRQQSAEDMVPGFNQPLREAREEFERVYLTQHLRLVNGSVSKIADKVGMERTHLYRKLRALGINPKQLK
jgi:DNA-binding NtrC family response regulator